MVVGQLTEDGQRQRRPGGRPDGERRAHVGARSRAAGLADRARPRSDGAAEPAPRRDAGHGGRLGAGRPDWPGDADDRRPAGHCCGHRTRRHGGSSDGDTGRNNSPSASTPSRKSGSSSTTTRRSSDATRARRSISSPSPATREFHGSLASYFRREALNGQQLLQQAEQPRRSRSTATRRERHTSAGRWCCPGVLETRPDVLLLFARDVGRRRAPCRAIGDDADGRRACRGTSRRPSTWRAADPDHRSADGPAVSGQPDSGQSDQRQRSGDSQPVPRAEFFRQGGQRRQLQLQRPGRRDAQEDARPGEGRRQPVAIASACRCDGGGGGRSPRRTAASSP